MNKPGIRLRHLESNLEEKSEMNLSPNTKNRKKIFDQTGHFRQVRTEMVDRDQQLLLRKEIDGLIESLKQKNNEIESRDQLVRKMKGEIEGLKGELGLKQKEINRLKMEVDRMERINKLSGVAEQNPPKAFINKSPQVARDFVTDMHDSFRTADPQVEEILSPFNALSMRKKQSQTYTTEEKTPAASNYLLESWGKKKEQQNPFQVYRNKQMAIDDSKEFKFNDFNSASFEDSGFGLQPY